MMSKDRNSNIELLRIISITMIIVSHYCTHGIGIEIIKNLNFGINRFLLESLTLGNFGSILFILISGYYLINSNKIKIKKILTLSFQVSFYSILIYLILVLLKLQPFLIKDFIKSFFPITFKLYWFASVYFILYLFHPYVNKFLNSLTQKDHVSFNFLMFFVFSILHTLTTSDYYGNEIIQFLFFYSLGAYVCKYQKKSYDKKINYTAMLISAILMILSIVCIDILGKYVPLFNSFSIYFLSRTSPLVIIFCFCLFNSVINKKERHIKFINLIGSLIFGVYLISDNKFLRHFIWDSIFNSKAFINSPYLILHIIISVASIIIVCLLIELIRKTIIENTLFKLLNDKIDKLQGKIEKITIYKNKKALK